MVRQRDVESPLLSTMLSPYLRRPKRAGGGQKNRATFLDVQDKWPGGPDRRRSGDLTIFSRALYQLSYRARQTEVSLRKITHPEGRVILLATLTGLEPATSAVTGRRANQLRYRAMLFSFVFVTPTGFEPVLPP